MVRKCMIVMMQIMRLILKTYSITVRLTPVRQQVMSFFYLDTSRHAEENEFVVNNTNVTGGANVVKGRVANYNKGFALRKALLGASSTVNTEIPLKAAA